VQQLLAAGANPNAAEDEFNFSPLHIAAFVGSGKVVQLLIAAGATGDTANILAATPLYVAVVNDCEEVVRLFMLEETATALANTAATGGWSPLHAAAGQGNPGIVQLLLAAAADVHAADPAGGLTPLHLAAREGHLEVIQLLLAAGANVDAEDITGRSPLHAAVVASRYGAAQLLLTAGANVNTATFDGITPLLAAAIQGRLDIATLLLHRGAHPQMRTSSGQLALYHAALAGHTAVVRLLLEATGQPDVAAADLVAAAKAGARGQHMATTARLMFALQRLWPAELPQLFQAQILLLLSRLQRHCWMSLR
jgi:ankyrin repeat protein